MSNEKAYAVRLSRAAVDHLIDNLNTEIQDILEQQADVATQYRADHKERPPSHSEEEEYVQACTVLSDQYKAACEAYNALRVAKLYNMPITTKAEAEAYLEVAQTPTYKQ